jgi:ribA/ribD-fused uncharacterized protein
MKKNKSRSARNIISYFDGTENDWLSNFATLDEPLRTEGGHFVWTVEHAFQADKATTPRQHFHVVSAKTAGEAKWRGKTEIDLRPDWKKIRVRVMMKYLRQKFRQPRFAELLLSTGDKHLMEGNHWHDTFWGVCLCEEHDGEGRNWLGHCLMIIRDELRAREEAA